jgi:hypothetical protein
MRKISDEKTRQDIRDIAQDAIDDPRLFLKWEQFPPGAAKPKEPARREPWQMTKREYQLSKALGDPPILNARDGDVHKNLVTMAVNEGKPVPERVLDSYPWLKKKAPEKKTARKSEFSKADERLIESLKAQGKSGIKYDETVEIEETGQTVTYPQDVSEMFTEIDEKAEAYNKIMDCIAA